MEYGLIGEKLGHSYSKLIHEQLADYTYDLCPLTKEEFKDFMQKKDFKAINVTIPYKRDVIPYLNEIDDNAKKIGAVNTIVCKDGRLTGYNTDYDGFLYTLKVHNINLSGKKVLVLGNGGASLAIHAVLSDMHADSILTVKYKIEPGTITYEEAACNHADADLIVNTSPVGMYPNVDASPMDLSPYHNLTAVIDIIYNPAKTKLLQQAESMGIPAINGLEMLVAQAKYAVDHFLDTHLSDTVIPKVHQNIMDSM